MAEFADSSGVALPLPGAVLIAGAAAIAAITLLFISSPFGPLSLALVGVIVLAAVWQGWLVSRRDPVQLAFFLMLFELVSECAYIPDNLRPLASYGLTLLFCFPAIPLMWRAWKGPASGFKLYLVYYGWCLITVAYSLAPTYSFARLLRTVLLFSGILLCVVRARQQGEVARLVRNLMLACIVVTLATAAAALVLPHSRTWSDVLEPSGQLVASEYGQEEISRFIGLFGEPNAVGEMVLVTVGLILTYFEFATRTERKVLVATVLLALALTGIADSRSGVLGLMLGGSLYLCWKYRFKGFLVVVSGCAMIVLGLTLAGPNFSIYIWRGDIWTATGRTDVWQYALKQIANRPITGYGYDTAGAILSNRYFPLWWGPWDEGPHSSLHDGYISSMVGVGIPATIFWIFIMFRPWLTVFRQSEDPWRLKRMLFFLVIPLLFVNIDESMINDCAGPAGLLFAAVWAVAEQYRLVVSRRAATVDRQALQDLPAAATALRLAQSTR